MIINAKSANSYYLERSESIDRYLHEIRKYKVLSASEERKFLTRYKTTGDIRSRDILVNCNQRFMYSAAKRYSSNPETVLELINEGNIGLLEAIDKFDMSTTYRLLTYAQAYIRRNMNVYMCNNKTVKRKSDTKIGSIVARERSMFIMANERQPTIEELRDIMLTKHHINVTTDDDLCEISVVGVDACVTNSDDDYTTEQTDEYTARTKSDNTYVETMETDDMRNKVAHALSYLDDKSRIIIKMLYGIGYDKAYTAEEVGRTLNLCEMRINQIRNKACNDLKYIFKDYHIF